MSSKKKKRAVEQDSLYPALEYINSMLELLQKNLPLFIYRESSMPGSLISVVVGQKSMAVM